MAKKQNGKKFSNLINNLLRFKKPLSLLIVTLLVVLWYRGRNIQSSTSQQDDQLAGRRVDINQEFLINGRDLSGNLAESSLTLEFVQAEIRDEVYIKGQRAQARNNKLFLVFDIDLKNTTNEILYLDLIDLVRLVEDEDTKVSPQITQGNLEARPQSTKKSNVGFIVGEDDTNFTIQIGELTGDKHLMEIELLPK